MDWKPITELRSVTCHMGSHSVTCHHRWTRPTLTPAMQAGTRFTYPGGMEGWVDPGVVYIPRWFTCPQTATHPGTNYLIANWPGVEPTTSQWQVQRPNRYTTKPPKSLWHVPGRWIGEGRRCCATRSSVVGTVETWNEQTVCDTVSWRLQASPSLWMAMTESCLHRAMCVAYNTQTLVTSRSRL